MSRGRGQFHVIVVASGAFIKKFIWTFLALLGLWWRGMLVFNLSIGGNARRRGQRLLRSWPARGALPLCRWFITIYGICGVRLCWPIHCTLRVSLYRRIWTRRIIPELWAREVAAITFDFLMFGVGNRFVHISLCLWSFNPLIMLPLSKYFIIWIKSLIYLLLPFVCYVWFIKNIANIKKLILLDIDSD